VTSPVAPVDLAGLLGGPAGVSGVVPAGSGFPPLITLGLLLVGVGAVILLAASGGIDQRMPHQVLPPRFALYPLVAGAAALLVAAMLWLLP
jgi:hypothetical protein